jgi:hypothetical protein
VLARLLQLKDRPTVDDYIDTNWPTGGVPEEVDDEELRVIELLKELGQA